MAKLFLLGALLAAQTQPPPPDVPTLTITVVYDNHAYNETLGTDWGFAALVEYGGHTVLFDTGAKGDLLLANMEALAIDPETIEAVVISHPHGDHAGGLEALLAVANQPDVYLLDIFPESLKRTARQGGTLVLVAQSRAIFELEEKAGIYTTGMVSGRISEQALVIKTTAGLAIITGCAHPGILRIIKRARAQHEDAPVHLVMGGFHLRDLSHVQLDDIIAGFREQGVAHVAPSHCTGSERAILRFEGAYDEAFIESGVGRVIRVTPEN